MHTHTLKTRKESVLGRAHAHPHVYMHGINREICTLKTQDHDALELNKGALLECKFMH